MQFKDVLKQYEAKPLGEKRRYAVLLPLIYDEQTQSCQVLYQIRSEHISQPGEVAFPGGRVEEIDYFVHGGRTIRCFVGRLKLKDWKSIEPNEEVERLFTIELDTLLTVEPTYYTLTSQLNQASDFPFDLVRNGDKYNFGQTERSIPFYRSLPENIWGMTAMFTHRFTEIVDHQNRQLQVNK